MFKQGELSLKPNAPNLNGRAGWDARIKPVLPTNASNKQGTTNMQGEQSSTSSMPACLQCPSCQASQLSTNKAFQLIDLDKVCVCSTCNTRVKSKDWMCSCQLKWHLCSKHQACTTQVTKNAPCDKPRRGTKRKGPFTHVVLEISHFPKKLTRFKNMFFKGPLGPCIWAPVLGLGPGRPWAVEVASS